MLQFGGDITVKMSEGLRGKGLQGLGLCGNSPVEVQLYECPTILSTFL